MANNNNNNHKKEKTELENKVKGLQAQVVRAERVIGKLQTKVGNLESTVAFLEVDRDSLAQYVQSHQEESEHTDKEE